MGYPHTCSLSGSTQNQRPTGGSLRVNPHGENSRSVAVCHGRLPMMKTGGIVAFQCAVLMLVGLAGTASGAGLLVNETLANEPGSVTTTEWIELWNWPDTGGGSIDLKGYRFVDGRDTTRFDTNLTIPPGGFVVLARKPTGADSFEAYWGDSSGVWGDNPKESFPVLLAKMSLRNSSDTVTLISPDGDTSRMLWTHDGADGVSIERIRPNNDDSAGNFAYCADPSGSTPGRINSVFPVRSDLALDSLRITPADPQWGDTIRVWVYMTNVGLGAAPPADIQVYDDPDPLHSGDALGEIGTIKAFAIEEGFSATGVILWDRASPGLHGLVARIAADGNPMNNTLNTEITVRFSQPLVIITEFLANPTVGGPDEWVEISNRTDVPINMQGVRFGDSVATVPLPDSVGVIPPGTFWVFCENRGPFLNYYHGFHGILLELSGWRELNNTGDRIRMIGPTGEIIDSVSFRAVYPDNRSAERVNLEPSPASSKFWKECMDPSGATPGRANSVHPIVNDLSLDSLRVDPAEPVWGEPITVQIFVTNAGFGPARGIALSLYDDLDLSAPGAMLAKIGSATVASVDEGERSDATVEWSGAPPGIHRIVAKVDTDGDSLNNSGAVTLTVRHSQPLVIISEYLANPTSQGPGEWVEITNVADFAINLRATRIGDSSGASVLPPDVSVMSPGAFWVLTESEAAFRAFYPLFTGSLVQIPGWRDLNNSGDRIRLLGAAGEIIDSLSLRTLYDGNRSVERLELSATFAGPDDWARSVDPSGATPGQPNSVNRDQTGSFEVSVSPNPIYLSAEQSAQIAYRMEIGELLTLRIYDRAGHLVRTIADKMPAATGTTFWNGTTNAGGHVDPGAYILLARSEPRGTEQKLVIVVGP